MSLINISDNHYKKNRQVSAQEAADLQHIANKSIGDIKLKEHPNLLIFPQDLEKYGDDIGKDNICELSDIKDAGAVITTGNILGFVGVNNTKLRIRSRFDQGNEDFFMHYMLQKVLSINMFHLDFNYREDNIFDFLIYFFPGLLNNALKQGVYKEYQTRKYNDSRVRGVIDVSRHIRLNIPFAGRIAYHTREYSYDNSITQLIRHTIEFIRQNKNEGSILSNNPDTQSSVAQIIAATPSYSRNQRESIINKNIKPVKHPYFSNYTELQRLCLKILRHDGLKYVESKNEVYGILFSGSWLWEEYLGIVLKESFTHYYKEAKRNKESLFHLFCRNDKDGKRHEFQQIIPDFLSKNKDIVADAKYIPLDNKDNYIDEKATSIYYKTITYMCRWKSRIGYLFYPNNTIKKPEPIEYTIIGADSKVIKLGFPIPTSAKDFKEFAERMQESENMYRDIFKQG